MFVLLHRERGGYRGAFRALLEDGGDHWQYWKRIARSEGRRFDLPLRQNPMFVSFAGVGDPASVFEVDPEALTAVLGWLGDGITLKGIWRSIPAEQRDLLSGVNWRKGF